MLFKKLYFVYRTDTKKWLVKSYVKVFDDAWGTFKDVTKGVISTRPQDAAEFCRDICSSFSDRYGRYGMKEFPKTNLRVVEVIIQEPDVNRT